MEHLPTIVPVLPIRNTVLFPAISIPLVVGRPSSLRAIEAADADDSLIVVIAQKPGSLVDFPQDPNPKDLFEVGTLCKIESMAASEIGSRQVVVTGLSRCKVQEFIVAEKGYLGAKIDILKETEGHDTIRREALFNNLKELSREILELLPGETEPLVKLVDRIEDPTYLTSVCAAYLNMGVPEKQNLLETLELETRIESLLSLMKKEREVLTLQHEMRDKMSQRLDKAQREALLREQLRTIRAELGDEAGEENVDEIQEKVKNTAFSEEAAKQANEELHRLKNLPSNSAEYHVIRTYLEWLVSLPWAKKEALPIDILKARTILDEDHYGLENVKRRIIQFLSVAKLKNDLRGPILCFVGPPGVGKTSLGTSIARALGRSFIRTSLGGVRDEAEIRGHRRTYVGAMPGRIIQSIKRAGTKNPLMMLDEIDKLHADFHGDPSAALLEVLDPEQNKSFVDHYIDVAFDLSDVFFITTANITDTIPSALLDRMEIIEINGYTSFEKLNIAKRYLIPKALSEHGILPSWVNLPDATLEHVISHYTREAGVRELSRKIAALLRGVAEDLVSQQAGNITPTFQILPERLESLLGAERFFPESAATRLQPGVATGLAWTPHGGDLLFIEAVTVSGGKGGLILTGQLGDVMKESAQIAMTLIRKTTRFDFSAHDIHIHIPAGAIPKDGPSAGAALLAALGSLLMGTSIGAGVAITGEITLRGAVLPVGGIKEKVLAASRGGLHTVILPKKNEHDLRDVPADVKSKITFHFVETTDEVLNYALGEWPQKRSLKLNEATA